VIRVLIVDDHPPIQAGLRLLLRSEPGIVPVATAGTGDEAYERATRGDVDVALLDFHLPDTNGIALCQRLRKLPAAPSVLLYSAFADERLALPAVLAGAHGVLSKGAMSERLFEAIRETARDRYSRPAAADAALLGMARDRVPLEDLPVLGMAADGTDPSEIGAVLGMSVEDVDERLARIVENLTAPVVKAVTAG
jgi:DNA-binding NarL/FixJ family response regulator